MGSRPDIKQVPLCPSPVPTHHYHENWCDYVDLNAEYGDVPNLMIAMHLTLKNSL